MEFESRLADIIGGALDAPYRCSGGASEGSIRLSRCCRAVGFGAFVS